MDQGTGDKVVFWQGMHREAGRMLNVMLMPDFNYYSADDHAYIVAWQRRQALCYRQVVRHRGF